MRSFANMWKNLRDAYVNRYEPENLHTLAAVYWHIVLSIVALVIFGSLCYGLWQLVSIIGVSEEEVLPLSPQGGTSILKKDQLEATVNGFAEREALFNFLKNNPSRLSDPSR